VELRLVAGPSKHPRSPTPRGPAGRARGPGVRQLAVCFGPGDALHYPIMPRELARATDALAE
jgi:hypothetical protein